MSARNPRLPRKGITIHDIALLGMMTAALEAGKVVLSMLPNIEIVSLLIILFALHFGGKSIYAAVLFAILENLIWGIGLWSLMYLYIWPLLAAGTLLFRRVDSVWFWSMFSALFGLLFGGLCSVVYLLFGGWQVALSWWIAGIPFDFLHGGANFVVMLILYHPLSRIIKQLKSRYDPK